MTLPAWGNPLAMSQINTELGRGANNTLSLNDGSARSLAGKPSGIISLSDFFGKALQTNQYSGNMVIGYDSVGDEMYYASSLSVGTLNGYTISGVECIRWWSMGGETTFRVTVLGNYAGPRVNKVQIDNVGWIDLALPYYGGGASTFNCVADGYDNTSAVFRTFDYLASKYQVASVNLVFA